MKKKEFIFILTINYLAFFFCILSELIYKFSMIIFIEKFFTVLFSINLIIFIFYKFIYNNFTEIKEKNNFDISIPPVESELKSIFDEVNQADRDISEEEDLFKELKFKDIDD